MGFEPLALRVSAAFHQPMRGGCERSSTPALELQPLDPPLPQTQEDRIRQAYEAGRAEAMTSVSAELEQARALLEALGPALDAAERTRVEALRQASTDVAYVVTAFLRRALASAFTASPEVLVSLIEQALAGLPDGDRVEILVPPALVEPVREGLGRELATRVQADPSLQAGCVVRGRHASIESTVQTALEGVEQAVAQWLGR